MPSQSPSPPSGLKASKPLSRRALAVAVRQLSAPGPSAPLLSPSPYLSDDVACFDFFRFRLTTAVSESKGSLPIKGFWNFTLLQASHAEPAVWHAVAALGALYRKWEVVSGGSASSRAPFRAKATQFLDYASWSSSSSSDDEKEGENRWQDLNMHSLRLAEQADTCYTRALSLARSVRDPSFLLVLSLALAATANLSGRWADSGIHYQAGQRIMSQLRKDYPGKPMTDLQINAAESLAKLGLQLLSFNEQSAPYPCAEIHEIDITRIGEPFPLSQVSPQDQRSWGIHRANIELVLIMRRILLQAGLHTPLDPPTNVDNNGKQVQHAIIRDLETWELETLYVLSNTTDPTHRSALDLLSIKLLHTLARLFVAGNVVDPNDYSELVWDTCLAHFERIVTLVVLILRRETQQNPHLPSVMSLDEPAINMALWLATVRCRHPVLRRRALQLLRGVRRLEGVWTSTSAAAAAGRITAIEEEGLDLSVATARLATWAAIEPALIAGIGAEDHDPRSWLGREVHWAVAVSAWDVPGEVVVPLQRRITQVDVVAEYDAHVGRSRADLALIFAGRNENGLLRRKTVSVYF